MDVPLGQQVGDAVGEDAGLAGAGAGHDEQRGAGVDDGGPLVLVQPLQERGGVQDGARGAVPVVGVPLRGRVELPAEQIVRNRLRSVIVLGRRRGFLLVTPGGLEARQEVVVKEAAHRSPSLGRPTDNPVPPRKMPTIPGVDTPCDQRNHEE